MRNENYVAKDWLMMSIYHYEQCSKESCGEKNIAEKPVKKWASVNIQDKRRQQ